jgi:hypothetical protein
MNLKICNKCGQEKPETEEFFVYRKDTNKFRNECKECSKNYNDNYYKENKKEILEQVNSYYQNNKDKKLEYQKQYNVIYKENIKKYKRQYANRRYADDIFYALRVQISHSVREAIKRNGSRKNNTSILKFLPFTIDQLKQYLESQFEPWMNWNNWGKYNAKTWDSKDSSTWLWNIDHIIPHSKFKYNSMEDEEFKKCWALENLRPYSAKQNIIDNNKRIIIVDDIKKEG